MNYKMDLSETLKIAAMTKGQNSAQQSQDSQGYITEKLYMLLQLYLQNKSWNPSIELLQCFTELKDSVFSNPAYLQVLSSRIALDSQGRLVLRDSGKIILPYEHFSNAVMLKHLSGPHGLHLSVEATVRSVMESYTIGRDNFGMEKDFILEVVQACPSSACRYYKGHMGTFMDQSFAGSQMNSDYLSHLQQLGGAAGNPELAALDYNKAASSMNKLSKSNQQSLQQQQQITAAIIQQQNRAMAAQQSLEKFGNLTPLEKQRILQQLDKKHYETVAAVAQANNLAAQNNLSMMNNQMASSSSTPHSISQLTQHTPQSAPTPIHHSAPSQPQPIPIPPMDSSHKNSDYGRSSYDGGIESYSAAHYSTSNRDLLALHNGAWTNNNSSSNNLINNNSSTTNSTSAGTSSILNNSSSTPTTENRESMVVSQDKIIRAFAELMRNMARMKTFIRPSMVKPYGKQSESLQKTLMDTIQLVQSLRNCLPPPHISVGNWKSEDRLRKEAAEAEQLNINRPIQ